LGLLQRQAAERIGVDETSIYNWESNRIDPAVRFIPRIHLFLGYCPFTPSLPITEWLKLVRQGLGYSQERMAELLGIDEGTWRRWEAGKRQPTVIYRMKIGAFLGSLNGATA
jgi:transcriptional regulator with XRE-family HTH domain